MSSHPSPKRRRRRVIKFKLDETSVVDKPSHGPARIAIMKRADDTPQIQKRMALTTSEDGHQHSIVVHQIVGEGGELVEIRSGITSWQDEHAHDWIMDAKGKITIAEADGHGHEIDVMVKMDTSAAINHEILTEGMLASLASAQTQASITAAGNTGDSSEANMSKQENTPATEPQAVTPEQLGDMQKRAERSEQIVKLSSEQRQYFDGLDSAGQDEFLGSENKDAIVKNAADENSIEYTADNGDEFRKSDDQRLVKMARERDEERRELTKERALRKRDDLLKRGSELLKSCSGDADAKASLLGAIEGIEDETMRKSVLAIVQAKDAGLQKAFETVGTSDDGKGEGLDADAKIRIIAKGLRENDPKLTSAKAYVAALDTPEGRELHGQLAGSN